MMCELVRFSALELYGLQITCYSQAVNQRQFC